METDKEKLTLKELTFRKIPILISKWNDEGIRGWRAELPDNYETFKTVKFSQINFEDLNFHFFHNTKTHPIDELIFSTRKEAKEASEYINKKYLSGKAKIWFL